MYLHNLIACKEAYLVCSSGLTEGRLIFMQIKLIFIRQVSHLDSLLNRGTRELGNGLDVQLNQAGWKKYNKRVNYFALVPHEKRRAETGEREYKKARGATDCSSTRRKFSEVLSFSTTIWHGVSSFPTRAESFRLISFNSSENDIVIYHKMISVPQCDMMPQCV